MKEKKVVFLSYDGITDPLGQSQILPYLLGLCSNKNYKITIVSFEKTKNYLQNKDIILNKLAKNNINWAPLKYTKYPPIFSTIWDIYKLKKAVNKLKNKGLDLIHCRSYITTLVALGFKKKYKIPLIFDMRGFYADERVDGKIWNRKNPLHNKIYKYFKKKEIELIQQSKHIVSLTNSAKEEIISWGIPNQSEITVIPCCTDENLFQLKNVIKKRSDIKLNKNEFIISYIGSIGTWYMLDEMLDFFNILLNKHYESKFLFITKDDPNLIFKKAKNKNIPIEKLLIQSSTRELMPTYISLSDFSIFFIMPVFSKKASSPTKMGEIMNMGVPVICNSGVGDVDQIMKESMPELLIKEFTVDEYERVINKILNTKTINKLQIISKSHEYYSLERGVKKYKEIYEKVLNTN